MAFTKTVFEDFEVFGLLDGPRSAREALRGRFGKSGGHLGRLLGGLGPVLGAILRQDYFPPLFDVWVLVLNASHPVPSSSSSSSSRLSPPNASASVCINLNASVLMHH